MVQVQGKVRARLEVPADISEDALREQALALPGIIEETPNGVRTVIVRAPKLVNVVPAGTEGTVFPVQALWPGELAEPSPLFSPVVTYGWR